MSQLFIIINFKKDIAYSKPLYVQHSCLHKITYLLTEDIYIILFSHICMQQEIAIFTHR